MNEKFQKIICRYGNKLCALALFIAPMVSRICRGKYFQPVEPEGLTDFADKKQNQSK